MPPAVLTWQPTHMWEEPTAQPDLSQGAVIASLSLPSSWHMRWISSFSTLGSWSETSWSAGAGAAVSMPLMVCGRKRVTACSRRLETAVKDARAAQGSRQEPLRIS